MKTAILVSGGLDSALLYYMLAKDDQNIQPLIIIKNSFQQQYALNVIDYIQKTLNIVVQPITLKSKHVKSAINEALTLGFNRIYVGVIKELEQFLIGWESNNYRDTEWVKGPLQHLDKSQVIDLIIKNNLQHLFFITHSCATKSIGRCQTCNRCRERFWGFAQLGLTDPGNM